MRAKEFVSEQLNKPTKRQSYASRGLMTFTKSNYDRLYDLNRVMMAVASTDGDLEPVLDRESWVAKQNTAHAYTDVEHKMLHKAFKAAGVPYHDINNGDMESTEVPNTNTQSPIKPFKGY